MNTTSRLLILDYFRKHQTATVSELGSLLGKTGANIRHHLEVLEDNDLVEVIGKRNEYRGRPPNIYGLSRRIQGDGLDKLAGALLDSIMDMNGSNNLEKHFNKVAQILAGSAEKGATPVKKLISIVFRLNEMHYQARWEAGADGARIILGHCPFSAIINDHPELCTLDAMILEAHLDSSVSQIVKLQISDKGLPYCAYLIRGI